MNNQSKIPTWLLEKETDDCTNIRLTKTGFLTKSLQHFSEVFASEIFFERYVEKPMLLQEIDPRVKLCTLLAFTISSTLFSNIIVLLFLAFISFLYAGLSGFDLKDFTRRIWAYIPVAVLVFSIPSATSLFVQGDLLFYIIRPGCLGFETGLYVSHQGLVVLFRLVLRSGISLSFAYLLLLTTRWSNITGALASMRVPSAFISILDMAYRYVFVITAIAQNMLEARSLRTIGKLQTSENRKFISHGIAYLFVKSHYLSEEIYHAMICRGYSGKPVKMDCFSIKRTDVLFVVNNLLIMCVLIAGECIF